MIPSSRLNSPKLILLIAVPVVLLFLPADHFDTGQTICLSTLLFDTTCPGCGMTRSLMHLLHLDLTEAVYYNPLGLVVGPLLGWVWFQILSRVVTGFSQKA